MVLARVPALMRGGSVSLLRIRREFPPSAPRSLRVAESLTKGERYETTYDVSCGAGSGQYQLGIR